MRLLTRDNTPAVAEAEDAFRDAGTLSRKINAWESRWPLNTYARDLGIEGLSQTMRTRLKEAEAMTLEDYQKSPDRARPLPRHLRQARIDMRTPASRWPRPARHRSGLRRRAIRPLRSRRSLLGVPAVSMPLFEIDGLPLGTSSPGIQRTRRRALRCRRGAAGDRGLKAVTRRLSLSSRSTLRPAADWRSWPSAAETVGRARDPRQCG